MEQKKPMLFEAMAEMIPMLAFGAEYPRGYKVLDELCKCHLCRFGTLKIIQAHTSIRFVCDQYELILLC
jgi:hypothetical protein